MWALVLDALQRSVDVVTVVERLTQRPAQNWNADDGDLPLECYIYSLLRMRFLQPG